MRIRRPNGDEDEPRMKTFNETRDFFRKYTVDDWERDSIARIKIRADDQRMAIRTIERIGDKRYLYRPVIDDQNGFSSLTPKKRAESILSFLGLREYFATLEKK